MSPWPGTQRHSCSFCVGPSSVPRSVRQHAWHCPAQLHHYRVITDGHRLPKTISTHSRWYSSTSDESLSWLCLAMRLPTRHEILQSLHLDQQLLPRSCLFPDLPGGWNPRSCKALELLLRGREASRAGWRTVKTYQQKQLCHFHCIDSWWVFAWCHRIITYGTNQQAQNNF